MQNRGFENAVFETRLLFDWKYTTFRITLIQDWVSVKYKHVQVYKDLHKHFLWTIRRMVQNLWFFTDKIEKHEQSPFVRR